MKKTDFEIVPFTENFIDAALLFTDKQIGKNYYSRQEMIENQKKSISSSNVLTSFLLIDSSQSIHGLRLAYPAGHWAHGKGNKLRPDLWPFTIEKMAYFQSLFISETARGLGFGPELSKKSIAVFKQLGNLGIITHCWKESPENTSFKYLSQFGFNPIIEHPLYWFEIDYVCTRDGKPCRCTAIEMCLTI